VAYMERVSRQASPKRAFVKLGFVCPWVAFSFLLAMGGCSSIQTSGFMSFPAERGGIASDQVLEVSNVVSRMRSEYPDLSATSVPYEGRSVSGARALPAPALTGKGRAVSSGEPVSVKLYLDKSSYSEGYVDVEWNGGARETLPIVAFDNKGRPNEVFDYIYLLRRGEGGLCYLVLVGGEYGGLNVKYVGFEGTLIVPGSNQSLETDAQVYKLDFGFRYPLPPEFEAHVRKAGELSGSLYKESRTILSKEAELDKVEEELVRLRNTPPAEDKAGAQEKRVRELEARATTLKEGGSSDKDYVESVFSEYFSLRRSVSDSYADFLSSNHYLWMDRESQLGYWKQWRKMQAYDEKVEEVFQPFLGLAGNPERLKEDRKQALRAVEKNNIKSLDPMAK